MATATIEAYFLGADDLFLKLSKSVQAKNNDEIKKTVHAIKGSASVFGESVFLSHLKKLDQLAKAGMFDEVINGISELTELRKKFEHSLKDLQKGRFQ
jgi:HPt (histidine-containing phosphotransfer) domain-containing protein